MFGWFRRKRREAAASAAAANGYNPVSDVASPINPASPFWFGDSTPATDPSPSVVECPPSYDAGGFDAGGGSFDGGGGGCDGGGGN